MKIYHKILLYQNKLLQPYVRILLRMMAVLTYMASLLLIVGVVYEHGFPLSATDISHLKILYKAVWIIFLIDVTLHIFLEYKGTKKNFRKLAWILSWLLYLTLVPVIFHRPDEEGAICMYGISWVANFIIFLFCFFFLFLIYQTDWYVCWGGEPIRH